MNVDIEEINIEKLRYDLIDYFGTAMEMSSVALLDLNKVENASDEEIVRIALNNGFNLDMYTNKKIF